MLQASRVPGYFSLLGSRKSYSRIWNGPVREVYGENCWLENRIRPLWICIAGRLLTGEIIVIARPNIPSPEKSLWQLCPQSDWSFIHSHLWISNKMKSPIEQLGVRPRLILSGCLRVVYTPLYQTIGNLKAAREAVSTGGDMSIPNNNDQNVTQRQTRQKFRADYE